MRVTIPDELAQKLEPHVTPTFTIDRLVTMAVEKLGVQSPTARFLPLSEGDINALESRLGVPAIGTFSDLYRAIDDLARVKIGNITLQFSPGQLREIEDRARREGTTPDDVVLRIVYAMLPQFFAIAPAELPTVRPTKKAS